ncbi:BP28CT and TUDOR domain containing protein [Trichuris trichiura]|uniref:HEAT repeat-containing protein 1 n=1 Tax=Trichuris trichiura TaxID=36087 RepID=A0A077ZJY6_TRITR|nr:BP28CT and TUDOR domain containing protein [Trichuris trichiura]
MALSQEKCIDKFLLAFLKTLIVCAIEEVKSCSELACCKDLLTLHSYEELLVCLHHPNRETRTLALEKCFATLNSPDVSESTVEVIERGILERLNCNDLHVLKTFFKQTEVRRSDIIGSLERLIQTLESLMLQFAGEESIMPFGRACLASLASIFDESVVRSYVDLAAFLLSSLWAHKSNSDKNIFVIFDSNFAKAMGIENLRKVVGDVTKHDYTTFNKRLVGALSDWLLSNEELKFEEKLEIILAGVRSQRVMRCANSLFLLVLSHSLANCKDPKKADRLGWAIGHCWHELVVKNLELPYSKILPLHKTTFVAHTSWSVLENICFKIPEKERATADDLVAIVSSCSSQEVCVELFFVLGMQLLNQKWDGAHMQASIWWTDDKSKEAAEIALYLCLTVLAEQRVSQTFGGFISQLLLLLRLDVEEHLKLSAVSTLKTSLHKVASPILLLAVDKLRMSTESAVVKITSSKSPAVPIAVSMFGSSFADVREVASELVSTWSQLLCSSAVERSPYFTLLDFLTSVRSAIAVDECYMANALPKLTERGDEGVTPLIDILNSFFDGQFVATPTLAVNFLNSVNLVYDQKFSTRAFVLFNQLLKLVIAGIQEVPSNVLYAFLNRYCIGTADLVKAQSDALQALLTCFRHQALCERATALMTNSFFAKLTGSVQEQILSAMIELCKNQTKQEAGKTAKLALSMLSVSPAFIVSAMESVLLAFGTLPDESKKKRRKTSCSTKMDVDDAIILLEAVNSNEVLKPSVELTSKLFEVLRLFHHTEFTQKGLLRVALLLLLRIFQEANELPLCDIEVLVDIFCQDKKAAYKEILLQLFQEWGRLVGPSAVDLIIRQFFAKKSIPRDEEVAAVVNQLDKLLANVVPAIVSTTLAESLQNAENAVVSIFVSLSSVNYESIIRRDSWIAVLKKLVEMIDLILSTEVDNANGHLWQLVILLIVRHVEGRWKNDKKSILAENVDGPLLDAAKRLSFQFPASQLLKLCDDLLEFLVGLQKGTVQDCLTKSDLWQRPVIAKLLNPIEIFVMQHVAQLFGSTNLREQLALLPKLRLKEMAPCFEIMTEKIFAILSWLECEAEDNVFRKSLRGQCVTCLERLTDLYPPGASLVTISSLIDHQSEFVRACALQVLSSRLKQAEATAKLGSEEDLLAVLNSLNNSFSVNTKSPEQQMLYRASLIAIRSVCSEVPDEGMPAVVQAVVNVSTAMHSWNDLDTNSLCITVLCLGELVKRATIQCFPNMADFMESVAKLLESDLMSKASVRRATLTATCDILKALPNFISPYLPRLICAFGNLESSFRSARPFSVDSALLQSITDQCSCLDGRFLLDAISEALNSFPAETLFLPFLFLVLKQFFAQCTSKYVSAQRLTLSRLFLQVLDRCNGPDVEIDKANHMEDLAVDAILHYAMKLTESELTSFVDTLLAWSSEQGEHAERSIVVFKLANALVDRLKGLFLCIAGIFATFCETLLDRCNLSKGDGYFSTGRFKNLKRKQLVSTLLMWFTKCCELSPADQKNVFMTSSRFDAFKDPLVDQLENTTIPNYKNFVAKYVIPCISCMVTAAADDSLRRQLSYAILLKSRDPNPQVRLSALLAFDQLLKALNEEAAGLVPEAVQFLSELMEDECEDVEQLCHEVVKHCEGIIVSAETCGEDSLSLLMDSRSTCSLIDAENGLKEKSLLLFDEKCDTVREGNCDAILSDNVGREDDLDEMFSFRPPSGSLSAVSYKDWKLLFEDNVDCISMDSSVVHDVIIGDWLSPLEFHVVFVNYYDRLRKLNRRLGRFYLTAHQTIVAEMFRKGMPCAVKVSNSKFRRAVTTGNASDECAVLLVDSGESTYVKTQDIRQLLRHFAELPPLAVQCQLEGAHRDMLYGSIINQFYARCKPMKRFKISIVGQLEDRLVVHLFDMEMNNLFDFYFGPLLRKNEMAKKQRDLAVARGQCKSDRSKNSDSVDEDEDEVMMIAG